MNGTSKHYNDVRHYIVKACGGITIISNKGNCNAGVMVE
jgi:hypothetical protein